MHKKPKILLIILFLIALVSYIFVQMNKPLEIPTMTVSKGELIRDFKENARIKTTSQITITPEYNAKIVFLCEEGSKVSKGDLLLQLDTQDLEEKKQELIANMSSLSGQEQLSLPPLYDAQIQSLDIAIELAKTQVTNLEQDLAKYKELYENGAMPKNEYDAMSRAYDDAQKTLSLKETEKALLLEQSQEKKGNKEFYSGKKRALSIQISDIDDKLNHSKVFSPSGGIVTNVTNKTGGYANMSVPIVEISNTASIIAVSDVLASDAPALTVNQPVKILQKIGEDTLEKTGKISKIGDFAKTKMSSLGLEEQRVEIEIQLDDAKNIIVGSDMDIIFETLHLKNVLTVPKSSVFEDSSKHYIWLIEKGKLSKREITTGKESDYEYEVISGLSEGEIVLMDPNNSDIKEGKKATSANNI